MKYFYILGLFIMAALLGRSEDEWSKISTPNVTIYTADNPAIAKKWAIAIEGFRSSLQDWFQASDHPLEPMVFVVFYRDKAYANFLGVKRGVTPEGSLDVSRFFSANGRFMAAMNSEYNGILKKGIFTQSSVWLAGSFKRPLPLWLLAGFQEIYGDYSFDGDWMRIGDRVEGNIQSLLEDGVFLPLDQLFPLTLSSPTYQNDRKQRFNIEAWALMHFLLLGNSGENRPALIKFVTRFQQGATEEEAMAEAFPEGIKALNLKFLNYVKAGAYAQRALDHPLSELGRHVMVTQPPQSEVDAILALVALQLRGQAVADTYLQRARISAPNSPLTLEAQGEMALAMNDRQAAKNYYAKAVLAGSKFYFASFYPVMDEARMMYGGELAADRFDPKKAREIADSIKRTIRQQPSYYNAREIFAALVGNLAEVDEDDRQVLAESMMFYPSKGVIQAGQVAYEIKTKQWAAAKRRVDALRAGDFEIPDHAKPYVNKLYRRLAAVVSLDWAGRYYQQGKLAEARDAVTKVARQPLLPDERHIGDQLLNSISAEETFVMVREAIAKKDFDLAETWLGDLKPEELTPKAVEELIRLKALFAAAKK